ncbi:restriction endonuclease fold toxin, partial [Nocardia seriolae]
TSPHGPAWSPRPTPKNAKVEDESLALEILAFLVTAGVGTLAGVVLTANVVRKIEETGTGIRTFITAEKFEEQASEVAKAENTLERTETKLQKVEELEAKTIEAEASGEVAAVERTTNSGRYSGELKQVDKADPDADKLAERLGGRSRVSFSSDSKGREFDTISDEYVAQAKPADFQVNKAFRDQAKATFDAAQETGRKVYYHFDGPPQPGVINKLQEYSQRYNIPLVIDTEPF